MPTGVWTPTDAAAHIDEVWPGDVIRAQEYALVIAPRVFRDWKFMGHGDVYHYPRVANIEAVTKVPGTPWAPFKYTDSDQTILIDTYEVTGFQVEDITTLLAKTPLVSEYKQRMGYALARRMDVNLANLFQQFTTAVGTLGVDLTYDDLISAWQSLAEAGITGGNDVTWFLSPAMVGGLLKLDVIISRDYRGDQVRAVDAAQVGTILGAPVVQSNLLRAPAAGQHEGALMDRRAIALIVAQAPKAIMEFRATDIATIVGMYQVYGYARILRYQETPGSTTTTDNWAVLIRGK